MEGSGVSSAGCVVHVVYMERRYVVGGYTSLLLNMVDMVLYTGVSNAESLTPRSHQFQGVTDKRNR